MSVGRRTEISTLNSSDVDNEADNMQCIKFTNPVTFVHRIAYMYKMCRIELHSHASCQHADRIATAVSDGEHIGACAGSAAGAGRILPQVAQKIIKSAQN